MAKLLFGQCGVESPICGTAMMLPLRVMRVFDDTAVTFRHGEKSQ